MKTDTRRTFGGQRPAPKALQLQRLQALRTTANIAGRPRGFPTVDGWYARAHGSHAGELSQSRKWARRRNLKTFKNVNVMERPAAQLPPPMVTPGSASPLAGTTTYTNEYQTDAVNRRARWTVTR